MANKTNVQKDVEASSWMVALATDKDAPQDLLSKKELRNQMDFVSGNFSFVPDELKKLWVTSDNVGKPITLDSDLVSKASTATKEYFTTKIESVKKKKEAIEKQKKLEEEEAKKAEKAKADEAKVEEKTTDQKKESWFTRSM